MPKPIIAHCANSWRSFAPVSVGASGGTLSPYCWGWWNVKGEYLPHAVLSLNGCVARFARPEACMECGTCQLNCPTRAIVVDSGVGCAAAMIRAALRGRKEATCNSVECA